MNKLRSVRVGSAAPRVVMAEPRGAPWVLAFVRGWVPEHEPAERLHAIRAELRGLGAVLQVLADDTVWSFRPDDELERRAGGVEVARHVAAAVARYGVPAGADAVFVIDADGVVRFAHVGAGLAGGLADALAAAGRDLLARPSAPTFNRREWAIASLVSGFTLALLSGCRRNREEPEPRPPAAEPPERAPDQIDVVLRINGRERRLRIEPRVSLLDALRERLALTGTKKGCDHGQCGACTVLIGGRRVLSCMTLAVMAQRTEITTIEGLAVGGALHPMQAAFVADDGLQCGYCTPGQIMSAVGFLGEDPGATDDDVRLGMSGNICRCGAYPNIVAAIQRARRGV